MMDNVESLAKQLRDHAKNPNNYTEVWRVHAVQLLNWAADTIEAANEAMAESATHNPCKWTRLHGATYGHEVECTKRVNLIHKQGDYCPFCSGKIEVIE